MIFNQRVHLCARLFVLHDLYDTLIRSRSRPSATIYLLQRRFFMAHALWSIECVESIDGPLSIQHVPWFIERVLRTKESVLLVLLPVDRSTSSMDMFYGP